jgi:hypothetical protein
MVNKGTQSVRTLKIRSLGNRIRVWPDPTGQFGWLPRYRTLSRQRCGSVSPLESVVKLFHPKLQLLHRSL